MSVWSLFFPIILSAVALFFASFMSWMVARLHKQDWKRLGEEDGFLEKARELGIKPGNYMFPHCDSPEDAKSEAFLTKMRQGPNGVITVFPPGDAMKRNLGLTFALFLGVSFCVAYLASIALDRGAAFGEVFRFVATAGMIVFLTGILSHAIWFRVRVVGHVIESVVYGLVMGVVFAALWP